MKNVILVVLVIAFLFTACNSNSDKAKEVTTDTTTKTEQMSPAVEQLYACSMHPEVIGKKDEACSKCGMKLTEPVKK